MKKRILSLLLSCLMILSIAIPLLTLPAEAAYDWSAQITDTYSKCLTKAGRSSFNGYCATYVNWQLVVLGINKSYVSGNGNKEFDNYKNKTTTTGGYSVKAYPASSYTVSSALNAITENGTKNAYNILLGFESTNTTDGKKYGHTCFIHAIVNGKVDASESFTVKIGGSSYTEGKPIVASISDYAKYYGGSAYTLDGIIVFGQPFTTKAYLNNSGKNYLVGTDFQTLDSATCYSGDTDVATVSLDPANRHDGYNSIKIVSTKAGEIGKEINFITLTNHSALRKHLGDNRSMVLSFWAKSAAQGTQLNIRWGFQGEYRTVTLNKDWTYYTVDMTKIRDYGQTISACLNSAGTIWLAELQLEDGTEPTAFAAERGTLFSTTTDCYGGTYLHLPANPTRNGYTFDGWYYAASGGKRYYTTTAVYFGNQKIYAHWTLNHSHDYTCTYTVQPTCTAGGEAVYTCYVCGDSYRSAVDALGHAWDGGVVTTPPTTTSAGVKTYTCTRCGAKKTESIPVLSPSHECPGAAFTDMPAYGTIEHTAIDWAVVTGVTTGTSATTFSPAKTVTRGQVVTFLWRACGCPEPRTTKNPFTDVKTTSYCYKAVLWANENNITNGTTSTTFSPNKTCSRGHILTFLYRQQGSPAVGSVTVPYTDVKAGAYYEAAMKWAYANGIDKGVSDTRFAPSADCTRVSTVVFLYRAITGDGRLQ